MCTCTVALAWLSPVEPISDKPAARPERQQSLWESPDGSVAIYLTFEVIDAINLALTQIAAAPPVRGAEIGGLLLGKSERRERLTVWIDRFEAVPCSYPRGPSWMLGEDEQDELAEHLAQPRDSHVVGFFRSHTRKDLFLSDEDMALFSRFFAEAANVFLLVKPFTTRPNLGGFFYWEGGGIHRTGSRLEFPFHRRELGGGEPAAVSLAVPPPQAWVRAEEHRPVPVDSGDSPEPMFLRHEQPRRGALIRNFGVALGVLTLAVGGYTAYSRYGGRILAPPPRIAARPTGTLGLSASPGEKSITLTWDGASPIVAAATRGSVEITEGSFHKSLEMSTDDLRAGRMVYSRPDAISDTVSFRIHVTTGQGEPFTEAVRFVSRAEPIGAAVEPKPVASAPRPTVAKPIRVPITATKPPVEVVPVPPVETPKVKAEAPKLLRPAPRREP